MFCTTNTFGQPESSPFASQSGFGLNNFTSSNPFAPKSAFGSPTPTPFGSQAGGSTPFGCSACGAGASGFGQNPTLGFRFAPTQSSPFRNTAQHSNHSLHFVPVYLVPPHSLVQLSLLLVPTPLPLMPQAPAFGATSTPAFGATSTPAFGATSIPGFGTTRSPFGSTVTAFGVSNDPASGSEGTFGASSTPAVAISSNPAFVGASSTPSFSFCSSPAFVQSTAAFGATSVGTRSSPFGSQSSSPAFRSTTFGQSAFWGQHGGSRVAPYTPTTEADCGSGSHPAAKLESISAMFVLKDKSHEELRLEDYQLGDKGGPQPAQPYGGTGFGVSAAPAIPFGSPATFTQTSTNPFYSISANPFSAKTPSFEIKNFPTSTTPLNPFQSTSPSLFGPTSSTGSSLFSSSATPFSSSPSIFGTGAAPATDPSCATRLNFSSSQASSLFNSTPAFGQATSTFGQNTNNFGSRSIFNTPSTGFVGNMFSSTLSSAPSSKPAAFSSTTPSFASSFQPAQTAGAFSFSNLGQTQSGGESSIFYQSNSGLPSLTQSAAAVQPVNISNSYGTLSAMPYTPSFSFEFCPAFGKSTSSSGSQPSSPAFGIGSTTVSQPSFGGSRTPYTSTTEIDWSGTELAAKLVSISAMPVYKDKSHEELRWADYISSNGALHD